MNYSRDVRIQMIPIDHITVLNPRTRGKSKFNQIVDNIAKLGLKRPVTVAPDGGQNGSTRYLLICGQGRLEGYIQLGQTEIPAIVIDRPKEDLLLMSLAENLARRQHSAASLLQEVGNLKERGYSFDEIAKKTDLHPSYVRGIVHLLKKGEDRLIQAVEKKQIPLGIAITIASADDKAVQRALTESYEKHELRGRALIRARRLIESRRTRGKSVRRNKRLQSDEISSSNVLRPTNKKPLAKAWPFRRRDCAKLG